DTLRASPLMPRSPPPPLFPYTTLFRSTLGPKGNTLSPEPATTSPPPFWPTSPLPIERFPLMTTFAGDPVFPPVTAMPGKLFAVRSEEHTSELQSRGHLVCRLLLEKKNR